MQPREKRAKLVPMWKQAVETLQSLEGRRIQVQQSLSRSREVGGHDRHFAATLQFSFTVKHVGWTMSGGHLYLNGDDSWLGILLENVRAFEQTPEGFVVTEHFEDETERQTTISVLE